MSSSTRGTIKNIILNRIKASQPHSIFFIPDFADCGSPETIRKILFQAVGEGLLEKVGSGIYAKPKTSRFGSVPVPLEKIAQAIAERDKSEILPSGSSAANLIGLSTQIPMNVSYITTGSSRTIKIGQRRITFRHASPRNFAAKGKAIPILIQGLKEIGPDNLTEMHYSAIKNFIDKAGDPYFDEDLMLAPVWIQYLIKRMR